MPDYYIILRSVLNNTILFQKNNQTIPPLARLTSANLPQSVSYILFLYQFNFSGSIDFFFDIFFNVVGDMTKA